MIMGEPQRIPGTERWLTRRQLIQRRSQRVQIGTLVHRTSGTPGLLGREIRKRPCLSLWCVNSGRISANDVAKEKSAKHGAPSREITMFPGVMSPCITPRLCSPATTRAKLTASPISSLTATASPPPQDSGQQHPPSRSTPVTAAPPPAARPPPHRAAALASRPHAPAGVPRPVPAAPSGSPRAQKRTATTRVRSLSWTTSVERADLRPAALLFPSDTFTPLPTSVVAVSPSRSRK